MKTILARADREGIILWRYNAHLKSDIWRLLKSHERGIEKLFISVQFLSGPRAPSGILLNTHKYSETWINCYSIKIAPSILLGAQQAFVLQLVKIQSTFYIQTLTLTWNSLLRVYPEYWLLLMAECIQPTQQWPGYTISACLVLRQIMQRPEWNCASCEWSKRLMKKVIRVFINRLAALVLRNSVTI